jgi:hypothetical protein
VPFSILRDERQMDSRNPVQKKVSCLFKTEVVEENSKKRSYQSYKVVATIHLKETARLANVESARPSEKLDGTCCYIHNYEGTMWLWPRLDRKPNKNAEKRFKKQQALEREKQFESGDMTNKWQFKWNFNEDFKEVPVNWIPASGVELSTEQQPLPDEIGHTPGWVPVDQTSRQHCWHLQCVDLNQGLVLVLLYDIYENCLILKIDNMGSFSDMTLEMIGTNVNGNPYKIGTKEKPIHFLVPHGEIPFKMTPPTDYNALLDWFNCSEEGGVEGVVWHCSNGDLFKVHRHHVKLNWPVVSPRLSSLPVKLISDCPHEAFAENPLLQMIDDNTGRVLDNIQNLSY